MISNPLKKIFVLLISAVTLMQSCGLLDELVDLRFAKNYQIQMDFEGDPDKEDDKQKIDKIVPRNSEENHLASLGEGDFMGQNMNFCSFIFEIPIPPPELS